MTQSTETEKRVVPYASFGTLENFIERLGKGGIPSQIDRGFVGGSGANQSQMMAALKFLGLIDVENAPTPLLHELVEQPERRADIYKSLVSEHYSGVLDMGLRATQAMLDAWFRDVGGVSGDTSRKAQTFFINLAKAGDTAISPFFRPARTTNGTKKRTPRRQASVDPGAEAPPPPPPPPSGPTHVHQAVLSSLTRIPDAARGQKWTRRERDLFVQTFGNLLDLFHPAEDEVEIE